MRKIYKYHQGITSTLIHKKNIHFHAHISTSFIENMTIQIKLDNQKLHCSVLYKRPSILLTNGILFLFNTSYNTIIAGDLNAKHSTWNNQQINSSDNILSQYIDSCNETSIIAPIQYLNRYSHNPDIIDIAIIETGNITYQLKNLTSELSFDHTSILLNLYSKSIQLSPSHASKVVNWPKFENEMNQSYQLQTSPQKLI